MALVEDLKTEAPGADGIVLAALCRTSWLWLVLLLQLCVRCAAATSPEKTDDIVKQFVEAAQRNASDAYDILFDDGLTIDGAPAPPREDFIQNYVTEALTRETQRILKEKGYDPPETALGSGDEQRGKRMADVEKKDSPQTLDGQVEQMAVQKRQRRAVQKRVRPEKQLELLAEPKGASGSDHSWEVSCGEPLYVRHLYDNIPGCTPGLHNALPCRRLVVDDFASKEEQGRMVAAMDKSFKGLFHQGTETMLVPETDSRDRMGEDGFLLTSELLERSRLKVMQALNLSEVYYSGSLLKRMDYPPLQDEWQIDLEHKHTNPHVDKANIASYDYSALLYFTSTGTEFGGGELVFHDEDADRLIQPLAGRLIFFTSGLENLHRVLPMTWGSRYVLSMWFTCSAKHAHQRLGPQTAEAETLGQREREIVKEDL
mmetsp:Transcript_70359/g.128906  ORF Transcript_70359/g.128906 Transcript_70359/m.128906 type:complete len:429 (+) Transcript_70359:93-1379(+)